MIAYLTPTVGLGCRSGGYLIYGVLATLTCALLICAFLLSHACCLRYQDIYTGRVERDFVSKKENQDPEQASESIEMLPKNRPDQEPDLMNLSSHRKTWWHSILTFLTITTRLTGKLIVFVNACWIIISAIFEYTGFYNSCWCATNAAVLGSRAWAVLFATVQSFQTVARNYWIGGVIFSFGVCVLACVGFFLGCKKR